jgi:hypothetical protein
LHKERLFSIYAGLRKLFIFLMYCKISLCLILCCISNYFPVPQPDSRCPTILATSKNTQKIKEAIRNVVFDHCSKGWITQACKGDPLPPFTNATKTRQVFLCNINSKQMITKNIAVHFSLFLTTYLHICLPGAIKLFLPPTVSVESFSNNIFFKYYDL